MLISASEQIAKILLHVPGIGYLKSMGVHRPDGHQTRGYMVPTAVSRDQRVDSMKAISCNNLTKRGCRYGFESERHAVSILQIEP